MASQLWTSLSESLGNPAHEAEYFWRLLEEQGELRILLKLAESWRSLNFLVLLDFHPERLKTTTGLRLVSWERPLWHPQMVEEVEAAALASQV